MFITFRLEPLEVFRCLPLRPGVLRRNRRLTLQARLLLLHHQVAAAFKSRHHHQQQHLWMWWMEKLWWLTPPRDHQPLQMGLLAVTIAITSAPRHLWWTLTTTTTPTITTHRTWPWVLTNIQTLPGWGWPSPETRHIHGELVNRVIPREVVTSVVANTFSVAGAWHSLNIAQWAHFAMLPAMQLHPWMGSRDWITQRLGNQLWQGPIHQLASRLPLCRPWVRFRVERHFEQPPTAQRRWAEALLPLLYVIPRGYSRPLSLHPPNLQAKVCLLQLSPINDFASNEVLMTCYWTKIWSNILGQTWH